MKKLTRITLRNYLNAETTATKSYRIYKFEFNRNNLSLKKLAELRKQNERAEDWFDALEQNLCSYGFPLEEIY